MIIYSKSGLSCGFEQISYNIVAFLFFLPNPLTYRVTSSSNGPRRAPDSELRVRRHSASALQSSWLTHDPSAWVSSRQSVRLCNWHTAHGCQFSHNRSVGRLTPTPFIWQMALASLGVVSEWLVQGHSGPLSFSHGQMVMVCASACWCERRWGGITEQRERSHASPHSSHSPCSKIMCKIY